MKNSTMMYGALALGAAFTVWWYMFRSPAAKVVIDNAGEDREGYGGPAPIAPVGPVENLKGDKVVGHVRDTMTTTRNIATAQRIA